ncbi:hypothetical protein AC579_1212 [Pseudocercospora musae]|uniref:Uncharacterized protein n=1 Tax=Pseudocercospora musae TaxID=113226 RepID=A0A139HZC8_9PEZI|nr:hypothetical protein AC579_1212 [Pseudocercospora musae]
MGARGAAASDPEGVDVHVFRTPETERTPSSRTPAGTTLSGHHSLPGIILPFCHSAMLPASMHLGVHVFQKAGLGLTVTLSSILLHACLHRLLVPIHQVHEKHHGADT